MNEPMTLGSPGSISPRMQQQFLPGFLAGSFSSPGVSQTSSHNSTWVSPDSSRTDFPNINKAFTSNTPDNRNNFIASSQIVYSQENKSTPVGPPAVGLFDKLPRKSKVLNSSFLNDSVHENYNSPSYRLKSATSARLNTSLNESSHRFNSNRSFNCVNTPETCDGWVTVFGFQGLLAPSHILQEFAKIGSISKHVISKEGNWIHIQYNDNQCAEAALNNNGILLKNIMIGVIPRRKPLIDDENSKSKNNFKPSALRSLTSLSTPLNNDCSLLNESVEDTVNQSVVGKALQYFFG